MVVVGTKEAKTTNLDHRLKILLFTFFFFIIELRNNIGYQYILSPQWICFGSLHTKWNILNSAFPMYTILKYEVYQDPGKGKIIAESVVTSPIAFKFTRYCLFSMLSIYVN